MLWLQLVQAMLQASIFLTGLGIGRRQTGQGTADRPQAGQGTVTKPSYSMRTILGPQNRA